MTKKDHQAIIIYNKTKHENLAASVAWEDNNLQNQV